MLLSKRNNMEANDITFEELAVGQTASFLHIISTEDVELFAKVSGDYNPLHMNEVYASRTPFKKPIVHGMYLGALCSQLVGMHLPGKRCLYVTQEFAFRNPAHIGDELRVEGTVILKTESMKTIMMAIKITCGNIVCLEGEALLKIL